MSACPDYKEVVTGRMVDAFGKPIPGMEVAVFDKDLLASDHLGCCVTGPDGRFSVDFTWSDYKDGPFEGRPDIFLEYTNMSTGETGKSKVFSEAKGKLSDDDSVETIDLGDITAG